MSYLGCSDGGCVFGHPGGMHTNGGCHCLDDVKGGMPRIQLREKIRTIAKEHRDMVTLLRRMATGCYFEADTVDSGEIDDLLKGIDGETT